jgi:23S rRNA pseudouridine955/2504/2580 synthase
MTVTTRAVTADEADIRLDRWFRRHYPWLTQGVLQKLCRTGQVRVDGSRAETNTRLAPGQTIRVPPLPEDKTPPAPDKPEIDPNDAKDLQRLVLYQDDHILALNKPHGLPVQGGPGIRRHLDGMLDALRFGSDERPRLVHRLDRDTSGLLLLARTPGSAAKLAAAFRGRHIAKTYWSVVVGTPDPAAGKIDRPVARIDGTRGERSAVAILGDPAASHAITTYQTLDVVGDRFAWLAMSPQTGRTHQLRVHAASIGTPILGDGKYGVEKSKVDGFGQALHLHARALRFPHPSGGSLSLEADLPPHMRETFKALGFHAPQAGKPIRHV